MALALWQRGERLACHSGLLLSQQGFDVHWQPQITFTSWRNIRFLSVFGLAPMYRTLIQLASVFAVHKQCSFAKRKSAYCLCETCTCFSVTDASDEKINNKSFEFNIAVCCIISSLQAACSCTFRWIYEWYASKAFSIHPALRVWLPFFLHQLSL